MLYNENRYTTDDQSVDEYLTIWNDALFKNYTTMAKLFDDEQANYEVAKVIIKHFVQITKEQPFYKLHVVESSVYKNKFVITFTNKRYKQSLVQSVTIDKNGAYLHTKA